MRMVKEVNATEPNKAGDTGNSEGNLYRKR